MTTVRIRVMTGSIRWSLDGAVWNRTDQGDDIVLFDEEVSSFRATPVGSTEATIISTEPLP